MLRMILRLDTFELPEIRDDEILVKVVSDSICMSTYKCAIWYDGIRTTFEGNLYKPFHAAV